MAAYSLPTRLGSVLGLLILNLFMPLWGANGEALSRGEFVWVKRGAWRMAFFGTLFVSLFGIAMVLAGNLIMDLWVGRSFKNQEFVLIFVVASAAVTATTAPYNMILNALGRADLQILPWICFACLTIGLKLILVSPDRIWYASAITFFAYSCTIMPAILLLSKRALRRASERAHPVAAELPIPR